MLNPKDKDALLRFLKDWAKPMQEIFDQRFGKNKLGHVLIAVDTGAEPTITFASNLKDADFKRLLRILSDKLNERKIITYN
jgi:hypothetical protein